MIDVGPSETYSEYEQNRRRDLLPTSFPYREVGSRSRGFDFVPVNQLLQEPEQDISWVLENRIPIGGFGLLAARPKVGKSTFALGLAVSVAKGDPYLGMKTAKGPVLYVAHEGSRNNIRRVLASMGADGLNEMLRVHFGPPADDPISGLLESTKEFHASLVIIDTLFRMFPKIDDLNNYAQTGQVMAQIEYLARATGAAILGLHHENKSNLDESGVAILGSTAILAAVDVALILKRNSTGRRELSSIQREGSDLEPTVVELGDSGLPTSGGSVEGHEIRESAQKIHDALADGELAAGELGEKVGGKSQTFHAALRAEIDSGRLIKRPDGKKVIYSSRLEESSF